MDNDSNLAMQHALRIYKTIGDGTQAFVILLSPDNELSVGGNISPEDMPDILIQLLNVIGFKTAIIHNELMPKPGEN